MRVVALHAIHFAFADGVMLRKVELSMNFQMAGETGLWIFTWVEDELSPRARRDVFAAGTMAGFAARTARQLRRFDMQARMRTGRKDARVIDMAIGA